MLRQFSIGRFGRIAVPYLVLGAVSVSLHGCSNAGAAGEAAEFTDTQYSFVNNAKISRSDLIADLQAVLTGRAKTKLNQNAIFMIHRVSQGKGTVLIERSVYDDPHMIDEEGIRKVTIYIPEITLAQTNEYVFVDGNSKQGALAVISQYSTPWELGCAGLAGNGSIRINDFTEESLFATIDLEFNTADTKRWRLSEDCPVYNYTLQTTFDRKRFTELSPWEGRATGRHLTKGERWPDN